MWDFEQIVTLQDTLQFLLMKYGDGKRLEIFILYHTLDSVGNFFFLCVCVCKDPTKGYF